MTPLGQALAYAAFGWPVFPCKPDQKAPDTVHGFKDATTDPDVIRGWWPSGSIRNVAIATGAPGPDVLDVDVKPDGSGFAAFNRLKQAGLLTGARALVRTPSGGLHAYYAGTVQPSGRLVRHFLDFKAAGGYVLAPPSVVGGKPYELLDKRQADGRIDWHAASRLLEPPRPAPRPGRSAGAAPLVAWVATLGEGNRNAGLYWAACRMAEADSPSEDTEQLIAAAVQAGLPEDEARRTVASAARKAAR
jgi:bifunctional DNA primase/polymerase-like protein